MSPPLVVAFAIAGRVDIDLSQDPLGKDEEGQDVYLRDIWPSLEEINALLTCGDGSGDLSPALSRLSPSRIRCGMRFRPARAMSISGTRNRLTFRSRLTLKASVQRRRDGATFTGARPLAIFGDSVTTDHISPAGAIKADFTRRVYLQAKGVDDRKTSTATARAAAIMK